MAGLADSLLEQLASYGFVVGLRAFSVLPSSVIERDPINRAAFENPAHPSHRSCLRRAGQTPSTYARILRLERAKTSQRSQSGAIDILDRGLIQCGITDSAKKFQVPSRFR